MSDIEIHQPNQIMRMPPETNFVLYKDHLSDRKADCELIKEMSEYMQVSETSLLVSSDNKRIDLLKRAEKITGE